MELLDDVCHIESHFGLFGDSASFGARQVHFGRTRWYSQVKGLKWTLGLEIVLILMQCRCTVCMERTICSEVNLDAPNGSSKWRVSYGILLWSVWRQCEFHCKIGARFATNAPLDQKPLSKHPMVLLGEEAQVKARFGLFEDSANLEASQMHGLHGTYHLLRNQFGCTQLNSQMMCVIRNLALIHLQTVLVSMQDRCTVLSLMHHRLKNHCGSTQ